MGTNLALSSGSEDSGSCPGIDDGARKTRFQGVQAGSRPLGFQHEGDPAGLHAQPGFLQRLPPDAGSHALARTRRPAGQHPVVAAVAHPADQEDFRAAEHNRRAAYVGACGLVHEYPFSCLAAESCRAAGGAGGSGR